MERMWKNLGAKWRRQRKLRSIFATASDGVLAVDADGRVIQANETASNAFAWPAERLAQMKVEWLITDVVDERMAATPTITEILKGPSLSDQCKIRVLAKGLDGRKFHARLRVVPIDDDQVLRHVLFFQESASGASRNKWA